MANRNHFWAAGLVAVAILGSLIVGCEPWTHKSDTTKPPSEPSPPPPSVMAETQREYLWEIENHGNKLARTDYGLEAFGKALNKAVPKTHKSHLAGDL